MKLKYLQLFSNSKETTTNSGFKRSEIDEQALSVSKQLEATKFGEEAGPQKNLEFLLISPTLYRPSKALSVLSTFTFHLQLTPLAGSKDSFYNMLQNLKFGIDGFNLRIYGVFTAFSISWILYGARYGVFTGADERLLSD
ncbi:hypothetical protein LXL04_023481 [Taraxacum kok-saghyz]